MLGSSINIGSPNTLASTAAKDVLDDILLTLGTDGDGVLLNRSTILNANTALTGVLIGTPVTPALAANSLIIANATSNGDILIVGNDGGHSRVALFFDASAPDTILYNVGGTWSAGATTWTIPAATLGGTVDTNTQIFTNIFEMWRAFRREITGGAVRDWPASTEVVSGTGSTIVTETQVDCRTGATHASTAGRYTSPKFPSTAGNAVVNWDKKLSVAFMAMYIGADATNLIMRFLLTRSTTIVDLAANGIGFQTNGANINLVSYGANGALATVSTTTNIVTADPIWVLIEHDPASGIRLYINGVLKATQSTAGDIPAGEVGNDYQLFASIARSGGADTGNERFLIMNLEIWQEL